MIIVQVRIEAPGNNRNQIAVEILQREDANDAEREIARAIEAMHLAAFSQLQADMPDDVTVKLIEPAIGRRDTCKMCGEPIEYIGPYWRHIGDDQPRHPALPVP